MYLCVCVSVLGAVKASGESGYVLSKSDVSYHQLQRSLFHNNMSECRRSNEYISALLCSTVSAPAKVDDDAIFSISIECICVSRVTERWYGVMFVSRLCKQKEQRLSFESETLAYWCVSVLMNYEQHQRLHIKCCRVVFVMFFGQQRGTVHVN